MIISWQYNNQSTIKINGQLYQNEWLIEKCLMAGDDDTAGVVSPL